MRTRPLLLTGILLSACSLTGLGPSNNSDLRPDDPGRISYTTPAISSPVLSSDGQSLAFFRRANAPAQPRAAQSQLQPKAAQSLYVMNLAKDSARAITEVDALYNELAWVQDDRSLFLTGSSQTSPEYGGRDTIWHSPLLVNLETGARRELSGDTGRSQQIPLNRPGTQSFYLPLDQSFRLIALSPPDKLLQPGQDRLLAYRLVAEDGSLNIISHKATDPEDKLTISRLDPATGKLETLFQLQGPVTSTSAEFSPNGKLAIVKTADAQKLILLDLTSKEHRYIESPVALSSLKWSPDSRHLLLAGPSELSLYSLAQPGFRRLGPASLLSEIWDWNSDSQQVLVLSNHRRLTAYQLDGSSRVLAELPADSRQAFSEWAPLASGWMALKIQPLDVLSKEPHELRLLQSSSGQETSIRMECQESQSLRDARAPWRAPAFAPGLAWHCPRSGISIWKPDTGLKQYRDQVLK